MSTARDPARIDTASIVVKAPAASVWQALMDPDLLLRWLPPDGMKARIEDFESRVGGGYRMTLTYTDPQGAPGKTTDHTDVVTVRFVELETERRIEQDAFFESNDPTYAEPMRMTWELAPAPGGTRVQVACRDVPADISPSDHEAGLRASLDNLAGLFHDVEPPRSPA